MLLLVPMMSSVGPKLCYLFPNPTWKVMVKLAPYIVTAPKYVLLASQIFWYAQQEQLLREECHYRDAVYGQKGQGACHLLYWYCWTGHTWWQQILRVHRFHFVSNCHMDNLSNGILMLHSQTHSRPATVPWLHGLLCPPTSHRNFVRKRLLTHYAAVMTINHYCPRFGHTIWQQWPLCSAACKA
jgi:hypothetical protein